MCLLTLAWRCHPRYDFVFVGNRDEFHQRPTAPAAWWPSPAGRPAMLAGRDLEAGGTWLGVRADGAFATVTNVREPRSRRAGARSRGELITDYLLAAPDHDPGVEPGGSWDVAGEGRADGEPMAAGPDPLAFLARVAAAGEDYAHFNLLTGRLAEPARLGYVNNVDGTPQLLDAGIHVLSNHRLNTPWPKATRTSAGLERLLHEEGLEGDAMIDALLTLFADRTPAAPASLPHTGLDRDTELALSSPFIITDGYGTRASTVLLCDRDGDVTFVEQSFDADGTPTDRVTARFTLAPPAPR
jgi:uncharacterized protein with NRDE domain